MSTKASHQSAGTRQRSRSSAEEGMSPKKMGIIAIVTVVGCIAILWPKVFHPMMFGSVPPKTNYKDSPQRGGPGGKFYCFCYRHFLWFLFIYLFIYRYCDRVFDVVSRVSQAVAMSCSIGNNSWTHLSRAPNRMVRICTASRSICTQAK